jgi:beta-aspartyl-peptidase (threonine type)
MNRVVLIILSGMLLTSFNKNPQTMEAAQSYRLVIHAGAGSMRTGMFTPEEEQLRRKGLATALDSGYAVLARGGTAVDAVEKAITMLEDAPYFNAGKGSVLTEQGRAEMDASIMEGAHLGAGSVASVTTIKNPIKGARAVMEKSKHVLLVADGAEKFAKSQGLEIVENKYFITPEQVSALGAQQRPKPKVEDSTKGAVQIPFEKYGTVGAVAIDVHGNLAAGTSTGGMMGKMHGRVGDSPIIGAGTYADNRTCAVSCTGWGEFFIKLAVAHDISAMMAYKGMSLKDAVAASLKKVADMNASGGVIAIDRKGNVVVDFNTPGMFRAYRNEAGENVVELYGH